MICLFAFCANRDVRKRSTDYFPRKWISKVQSHSLAIFRCFKMFRQQTDKTMNWLTAKLTLTLTTNHSFWWSDFVFTIFPTLPIYIEKWISWPGFNSEFRKPRSGPKIMWMTRFLPKKAIDTQSVNRVLFNLNSLYRWCTSNLLIYFMYLQQWQ